MYAYIYDDYLNQPKFGKLLYQIEKRLTDLNLNGKIIRLGPSKSIKSAIDDEIRLGTKTIIAVGNDKTVSQTINHILNNRSDERHQVTLGIIPIDPKESKIAVSLGIKSVDTACETLLARRLNTFPLTQINQDFFVFKAALSATAAILEIDRSYIIQNIKPALIEITSQENNKGSQKLILHIYDKNGGSNLAFNELLIVNKDTAIITDDSLVLQSPARIKPTAEKIRIIIGKDRKI
jgi:hypothetical protein